MSKATGRRRRRLLRLALLAVAGAAAVVAVEFVLRAFDLFGVNHPTNTLRYRSEALLPTWTRADGSRDLDGTLFRHRPGTATAFGSFALVINSLGFRGPEIARAKPAGTFRIAVLGDSVTLGWGVDDEATFCRRLERELSARGDGRRYEVLNTGHLMYDSMQEAALLEREVLELSPDLVLLVFVTNDVVEPTFLLVQALLDGGSAVGERVPTWRDRLVHQGEKWLPAWSILVRNVAARLAAAPGGGAVPAATLTPDLVPNGALGWQRSQQALRRIRDLCTQRALPFLVLDHTLPRLPVLAEFCQAEGIALHDFRFTPDELGRAIYNSLVDSHANALGNELLLDKLRRALAAAGVLPP